MNRVIKPSSENTQEKEEDDPPDSLVLKNRISKIIRQEEPDKKFGSSFFVLKERGAINIKPGFNERGIRFNLELVLFVGQRCLGF